MIEEIKLVVGKKGRKESEERERKSSAFLQQAKLLQRKIIIKFFISLHCKRHGLEKDILIA